MVDGEKEQWLVEYLSCIQWLSVVVYVARVESITVSVEVNNGNARDKLKQIVDSYIKTV